jgi:hypothetical protein
MRAALVAVASLDGFLADFRHRKQRATRNLRRLQATYRRGDRAACLLCGSKRLSFWVRKSCFPWIADVILPICGRCHEAPDAFSRALERFNEIVTERAA